ncbi:MAG: S8 family serine peptidase, partial [Bryobacteraceae bacterium]
GRPAWESYLLDPLCQAAEAAWQAGIVVVAAAGNSGRDNSVDEHGYGTIAAPGNDPYVITVGAMNDNGTATRSDDVIASYSSKGPTAFDHIVKPDLVAPGNGTVSLLAPNSTLATNYPVNLVPNSYYQTSGTGTSSTYLRLSGTSMATPVVSGAAVLLLQQDPSLTPDQVKARLMKTAEKTLPLTSTAYDQVTLAPYTLQGDIFEYGAGYLDIEAALNNTDLTSLPALSATAASSSTTSSSSNVVTISRNFSTSWGSSTVWSDLLVYGSQVFSGVNASGLSILWGSTAIWDVDDGGGGFYVIWGEATQLPALVTALAVGGGDFSVVWGD